MVFNGRTLKKKEGYRYLVGDLGRPCFDCKKWRFFLWFDGDDSETSGHSRYCRVCTLQRAIMIEQKNSTDVDIKKAADKVRLRATTLKKDTKHASRRTTSKLTTEDARTVDALANWRL